jgi:hypothetical protein
LNWKKYFKIIELSLKKVVNLYELNCIDHVFYLYIKEEKKKLLLHYTRKKAVISTLNKKEVIFTVSKKEAHVQMMTTQND